MQNQNMYWVHSFQGKRLMAKNTRHIFLNKTKCKTEIRLLTEFCSELISKWYDSGIVRRLLLDVRWLTLCFETPWGGCGRDHVGIKSTLRPFCVGGTLSDTINLLPVNRSLRLQHCSARFRLLPVYVFSRCIFYLPTISLALPRHFSIVKATVLEFTVWLQWKCDKWQI